MHNINDSQYYKSILTLENMFKWSLVLSLLFAGVVVNAQVKIGDNYESINPASLLELETSNKGILFPRVEIKDITEWGLQVDENGNSTEEEGMVVFNTSIDNGKGLYVWYNKQWNKIGGNFCKDSISIKGFIMYGLLHSNSNASPDLSTFKIVSNELDEKPNNYEFSVTPPGVNECYAFAIPQAWSQPLVKLKVANTNSAQNFFALHNCWQLINNVEFNNVKYQVWLMDVPLNTSIMHSDLKFLIQ